MREFWPPPAEGPHRDLIGYGRHVPAVRWPGGARVAVSLCLNVEEGSERSFAAGDNVNENSGESLRVFPPGVRNLAMESIFEYGSRAGVHRILRLFDRYGVKCTAFAAAVALAINREVADWLVEADHEICSHGWRWSEQWTMSRDEQRDRIHKAIALFEEVCGKRPDGWYSRYGPSIHTRERRRRRRRRRGRRRDRRRARRIRIVLREIERGADCQTPTQPQRLDEWRLLPAAGKGGGSAHRKPAMRSRSRAGISTEAASSTSSSDALSSTLRMVADQSSSP